MTELEVISAIIKSGAITLRSENEEPFIYSSGNRGPGYIMIKGLVGQPAICQFLVSCLVQKINEITGNEIDFINGNVTGGMIYGWEIRNQLSSLQHREIPYVYMRGSRKEGGHNELITGDLDNPLIKKGMNVLIVEELVNFGETTINAINVFRAAGYKVKYAACILSYDYPEMRHALDKMGIQLISLITLPRLLEVAKEHNLLNKQSVDSYTEFLADPIKWQLVRKYAIPESGLKQARKLGYQLREVHDIEKYNLPVDKVRSGVKYFVDNKEYPIRDLIVALDYDNLHQIESVIDTLATSKETFGYKLNLDFVMFNIPSLERLIGKIKSQNRLIFIDLKMWNGTRTMKNILKTCVELGVDIVNIYGHVGPEAIAELSKITSGTKTKLFVLTVLTHYDDNYVNALYGKPIEEVIRTIGTWAHQNGADGLILPGPYLPVVKDLPILKLSPGIRPDWFIDNKSSQVQTSTPRYAISNGANYIVVGSPILESANIELAISKINKEITDDNNVIRASL